MGVARGTGGELDEERRLAHVGGHALELEGLEARPAEEGRVLGSEAAEQLCDVLVRVISAERLLLRRGHLRHRVLADRFVGWPVLFLALGRLIIKGRSVSDRAPPRHHGERVTHAVICGHLHDVRKKNETASAARRWEDRNRNRTHATTAKAEWLDCGLFCGSTGVAYSNAPLPVAVGRRGEVVGGSGSGVVSSHYSSVARDCAEKGKVQRSCWVVTRRGVLSMMTRPSPFCGVFYSSRSYVRVGTRFFR